MALTCDVREDKVIAVLQNFDERFQTKQLDLADFVFECNGRTLFVERKTLDDYSASIIDGRYKEQQSRLVQMKQQGHLVLYIIENMKKTTNKGIPYKTLLSAILSCSLVSDIPSIRTANINETVEVILLLSKLMKSDKFEKDNTTIPLVNTSVLRKKEQYTPEVVFINMLCCIPKVNTSFAKKVVAHYNSLNHLIDAFKKDDNPYLLNTIDGIGDIKSKNIYDFLFP